MSLKSSPREKFWSRACRDLSRRDPRMKKLIQTYSGDMIQPRGTAFETLLRSIVGQQISVKAAQSIWRRVGEVVDVRDPASVLKARVSSLRRSGLSERKVEYARDLAHSFVSGKINPRRWKSTADEVIIEELVSVRGIGRWTAEMFLIFHLLRPNVFPFSDLGLQKGVARVYGKKIPLGPRQVLQLRSQFDPWCSVATWYLWRSLDPAPK